ncbi:MAG: echA8 2 [Hyphomicrobiales bacterium]|nr:echA8 2 [Hyphomicrobiales bacterium]
MAYFDLPLGAGPGPAPVVGSSVSLFNPAISRDRVYRPVAPETQDVCGLHFPPGGYRELDIELDGSTAALWCFMRPNGPPSFTPSMLGELISLRRAIANHMGGQPPGGGLRYFVGASRLRGIYNLGGDLGYFVDSIRTKNRDRLMAYAIDCCDVSFNMAVGFETPVVTIGLVQGDALGGGFEGALSFQIVVAEKKARMGLPEVLFNLFPGMGAFSLLARKIGMAKAERMILSGKIYTATELYEMGVVDVLAEDGQGEAEVRKLMGGGAAKYRLHHALSRAKRCVAPVTFAELQKITEIWVDTAMQLEDGDLRKMERLAIAQRRRLEKS